MNNPTNPTDAATKAAERIVARYDPDGTYEAHEGWVATVIDHHTGLPALLAENAELKEALNALIDRLGWAQKFTMLDKAKARAATKGD